MATPEFVLELRRHIGTAPLPLVGVTAVVFRDEKVLMGRRADNGRLACVSGWTLEIRVSGPRGINPYTGKAA
jgi:hypothetical protein